MFEIYVRLTFLRQVSLKGLDCKLLISLASGVLVKIACSRKFGDSGGGRAWKQSELPAKCFTEGKTH